ncbi:MAG: protein of unknown function DUF3626 [Terrestrivirus sp.]|uniref:Uncharacterized protein n=1 Tax=Terrestrivirus sp. TaxID=2487775 RepID=A0A3G4ZNW6_9VIRU|nr:MAG: protein of unknown function DUF3626 [Terrestrivirus sp.]
MKDARLTPIQDEAIAFFKNKSKIKKIIIKFLVYLKFKRLGYTKSDINKTIEYITNIPAIIHVNLYNIIDFLLDDTHYRNLFETKTSGGCDLQSVRFDDEQCIFKNIYDKCENYEKVKYGVLNIFNDQNGVKSADQYGDSYLQLKDTVKYRISFVNGDSTIEQRLCSFDFPEEILYYVEDKLFKYIVSRAKGEKIYVSSHEYIYMGHYIEIQIHGPVEFGTDIEFLAVNRKYTDDDEIMEKIKKFCNTNNIHHKIIDGVLDTNYFDTTPEIIEIS